MPRFQPPATRSHSSRTGCVLVLAFLLFASPAGHAGELPTLEEPRIPEQQSAGNELPASAQEPSEDDLRFRNRLIIGGGAGLIGAYGLTHWWDSGMTGKFQTTHEGWFGSGTRYGGMDKLGHAYSNYGTVRVLTPLFELAGNSRESSVRMAGWSALGIYTGIEIVDGFSKRWRFSPEDTVANITGLALGLAMETHPEWDQMFDFRMHYRRSSGSRFAPAGDYEGQKYLLVLKADGFAPLREHRVLRYLEVAVGYGARGFDPIGNERHRNMYFGLSLNLARLLGDGAYEGRMHSTPFQRGTDVVFDLVQFPTIGYARHGLD